MKINHIIVLFMLALVGCDNVNNQLKEPNQVQGIDSSIDSTVDEKPDKQDSISRNNHIDAVQTEKENANLESFDTDNFLIGRFLIGPEDKLLGFRSLNIKGDVLYEFDKNGNITATYFGISNNYDNYTYDKDNRLIKEERKQHNPPEIYGTTDYFYSKNDEVIKVVSTELENNSPVKADTLVDFKRLEKLEPNYYKRQIKQEYFSVVNKNIITTVQENLVFCCGYIMNGKNELTYYLNDKFLIDSLVIEGINNDKIRTLVYEYE